MSVVSELRSAPNPPSPTVLHERLVDQVKSFDRCARAEGLSDRVVLPSRYFLCALLDEAVLSTPWGHASAWRDNSLLQRFHNERWGGQKFFDALDQLLLEPSANRQLLELAYLCLAMGFQGRFRGRQDGDQRLLHERRRLYASIREQHLDADDALSPRKLGDQSPCPPRRRRLPVWWLAVIATMALAGLMGALVFDLHRQSAPVSAALAQVGQAMAINVEQPALLTAVETDSVQPAHDSQLPEPTTKSLPVLRRLLAEEIGAGRLEVEDRPRGETVLLGGELFAPGRAELQPAFVDQVARVAAALKQLPGPILIAGHTDSLPIRTRRFPSNLVLSQARAESVTRILAEKLGSDDRLTAEGRGDTEPRLPDDPANGSNRRVEITLLRGDAPAAQTH